MSFLINGVGYHILVHALPVQVAQQGTLTGVVIRAVGMMYLVDMDDTPGYKLTVVLKPEEKLGKVAAETMRDEPRAEEQSAPAIAPRASTDEITRVAEEIIEEARQKLEALARGELPVPSNGNAQNLLMGVFPLQTTQTAEPDITTDMLVIPSGDSREPRDEDSEVSA